MARTKNRSLYFFLLFGLLVVFFVVKIKGYGQLGNALSFVGGLLTSWPPFRQFAMNFKYTAIIRQTGNAELDELNKDLDEARKRRIMAFSAQDFSIAGLGVVLMALGFLVSIITSKADA